MAQASGCLVINDNLGKKRHQEVMENGSQVSSHKTGKGALTCVINSTGIKHNNWRDCLAEVCDSCDGEVDH